LFAHRRDLFTRLDQRRVAQSDVRDQIWKYYWVLKAYRRRPTKRSKAVLDGRIPPRDRPSKAASCSRLDSTLSG